MRGGVLKYAAQATSQIDAEIGKKDHFWMETNLCCRRRPPGFLHSSRLNHIPAFVWPVKDPPVC